MVVPRRIPMYLGPMLRPSGFEDVWKRAFQIEEDIKRLSVVQPTTTVGYTVFTFSGKPSMGIGTCPVKSRIIKGVPNVFPLEVKTRLRLNVCQRGLMSGFLGCGRLVITARSTTWRFWSKIRRAVTCQVHSGFCGIDMKE